MAGTSDESSSEYIGAYLEEMREMKKRTTDEVAAAAGVTRTSILNYERGKVRVPLQVFVRICYYLGRDPLQVLSDVLKDNDIRPLES